MASIIRQRRILDQVSNIVNKCVSDEISFKDAEKSLMMISSNKSEILLALGQYNYRMKNKFKMYEITNNYL